MTNGVVCVGEVMIDIVARLPGQLAMGSDTPAPIRLHGGGAAANVAAWLAAVGCRSTFVGRVGNDAFGRQAVDDLSAVGVKVEVTVDPLLPTGRCIVIVDPSGERSMIPDAGANSALTVDALPQRLLDPDSYLYLSGYSLLDPGARAAGRAALALARERQARIAVDVASAAPLTAAGPSRFLSWIGGGLLALANADEAHVLTDEAEPEAAARELARRCGEAVVKMGAAGSCWSDGDETVHLPSQRVAVVDTTGAGDSFAAGFLAARLAGANVTDCLRAGTKLAARAIAQVGARPTGLDVSGGS